MSSQALLALQLAINSNTLTTAQQAALSEALDLIIPTFPTPDELSNSIPVPEETLARDWIAALYTIQAQAGPTMALARIVTPNPESSLPAPFEPTVAGKVLLVADVTPTTSGLLLVSVNLSIVEDAPGAPGMALIVLDNLAAVTGGTLIAPGLTAEPTSTTPPFSPGGVNVMAIETKSFTGSNPNDAVLTLAAAPVQVTVGHRVGLFIVAVDTGVQNWTAMGLSMSVIEQPLG